MRKIDYLILHTTAGNRNNTVEDTQHYFLQVKKWKTGGYHWLIEMSGEAKRVYPDEVITNGVLPFRTTPGPSYFRRGVEEEDPVTFISNKNSVHISWVGGINGAGNAADNRTQGQVDAQVELILTYLRLYPDIKILGHNQIAKKDCPCFGVPEFCRKTGVKERNIYAVDHFGILKSQSKYW